MSVFDKLEPEADRDHPSYDIAIALNVALSQAISLKRIADALEKLLELQNPGLFNG